MNEKQQREMIMALEALEREKNIKKEDILLTIEEALISGLRKNVGKTAEIEAHIDTEKGKIKAYHIVKVVKKVEDEETEISLDEALSIRKRVKMGEDFKRPLEIKDFSRIAAQIAKQVLIQKVRGIERDNLYNEFKPREGEVITGLVRRYSDRDVVVDLGKAEAILPYSEQLKRERYPHNSRVKAIIVKVMSHTEIHEVKDDQQLIRFRSAAFKMDKGQKGPYIFLSRTSPDLLEELFKVEVSEIADGIIELKGIERDPGVRAKVMVKSNDSKIDPIGTWVGLRGTRIRAVTGELNGERIDLLKHSEDAATNIINAISPAKATSLKVISYEEKKALIIVPDDQLAIAIGKDWQNIKLASRITGWQLEVKGENELKEEGQQASKEKSNVLSEVDGIGAKTADLLVKAGMGDVEQIAGFSVDHLTTIQGLGAKTAEKIIEGAKKYVADSKKAKK